MSTTAKTRQLELEAAERRLIEQMRSAVDEPSASRRLAVVAVATVLFAVTFVSRLAIHDPPALIANFYAIPIALLAVEFGARAGILAAVLSLGLVFAWSAIETVEVGVLGYTSRGAALLLTGALVGRFSDRLRQDIAVRRLAQRNLSLYAEQLERANADLAQSVERLEAFAQIARVVGGETDLERVLSLILRQGREIVAARRLLVCLPDGHELVAVTDDSSKESSPVRLPIETSLAGAVLTDRRPRRVTVHDHPDQLDLLAHDATAAILVPLVFRGETVGVLAGIDREDRGAFEEEDEQLLMSVAASAATAVATARSVAAERLRFSLEAAEQARARWARELHDETLQGLTGARMVLSAGLARHDLAALHRAAEAADGHLATQIRSLRDLITELRPAALDDLGLGPAIQSLAKRQAAAGGFEVELELALDGDTCIPETESCVYRIAQEALSNVVKHARAEHVNVRVRQLARHIRLEVEDDGRGFDSSCVTEGFGLTGMQERAALLGGEFSIDSTAGGPTLVLAVLPLSSPTSTAPRPAAARSSRSLPTDLLRSTR